MEPAAPRSVRRAEARRVHRQLHRWPERASGDLQQAPPHERRGVPRRAAHAGQVHPHLRRAPGQARPRSNDRGAGQRRRRAHDGLRVPRAAMHGARRHRARAAAARRAGRAERSLRAERGPSLEERGGGGGVQVHRRHPHRDGGRRRRRGARDPRSGRVDRRRVAGDRRRVRHAGRGRARRADREGAAAPADRRVPRASCRRRRGETKAFFPATPPSDAGASFRARLLPPCRLRSIVGWKSSSSLGTAW